MAQVKKLILDGVRDHVVSHIAAKGTDKEMWDTLSTLYQGTSERKLYLEEKLRCTRMQKGEHINPYPTRIQENRDQWSTIGAAPQATKLVRLALNSVSEEWEVFVQSILDRDTLPKWDRMWVNLQQEELR